MREICFVGLGDQTTYTRSLSLFICSAWPAVWANAQSSLLQRLALLHFAPPPPFTNPVIERISIYLVTHERKHEPANNSNYLTSKVNTILKEMATKRLHPLK